MNTKNLFGTDGIRANIGSSILAPENIARLGQFLADLAKNSPSASSITIGRDTRASGEYIESALVAGILARGVDCHLVGILPTAGVAFLGKKLGSYFTVVISASHNSYEDNGLKIFGPQGRKISQAVEEMINQHFFSKVKLANLAARILGKINHISTAKDEYLALLMSGVPRSFSLADYRVVVDCGHGAATAVAQAIFAKLGCETKFIGNAPNGQNINHECGSEHPIHLKNEVVKFHAQVGIGFDGDADRVIFIDEKGESINGDALIAAFSIYLNNLNQLKNKAIVATVMSSIALHNALKVYGIKTLCSGVGDRQVAELMDVNDITFGGESSGHLIFSTETACGDGLYSALQFLVMMKQAQVPLTELFSFFKPTPYVVKNIDVDFKVPLNELPKTQAAIDRANAQSQSRVLFRYSGTEMKARLLVEAKAYADCQRWADEILQKFTSEILERGSFASVPNT